MGCHTRSAPLNLLLNFKVDVSPSCKEARESSGFQKYYSYAMDELLVILNVNRSINRK